MPAEAVRLAPCGVLTEDAVLDATDDVYILSCQLHVVAGRVLNISAGVTIMALA